MEKSRVRLGKSCCIYARSITIDFCLLPLFGIKIRLLGARTEELMVILLLGCIMIAFTSRGRVILALEGVIARIAHMLEEPSHRSTINTMFAEQRYASRMVQSGKGIGGGHLSRQKRLLG